MSRDPRAVLVKAANELLAVHGWLGALEVKAAEVGGELGRVEVGLHELRAMSRTTARAHGLIRKAFEAFEVPAAAAPGRRVHHAGRPGAEAAGEAPEQGVLFSAELSREVRS